MQQRSRGSSTPRTCSEATGAAVESRTALPAVPASEQRACPNEVELDFLQTHKQLAEIRDEGAAHACPEI